MNKKILIINGSPHKSSSKTMRVTGAFTEGLKSENDIVETFCISDLHITPCKGCLSCWGRTEGKCVITDDDMPQLKEKFIQADYIILSFPLYLFGIPGPLKTFADRMLPLLCAYRGQQAPENGESFHGIRYEHPGQKLIMISSCAYAQAEIVYRPLIMQFEYICGRGRFIPVLCPQLQTLIDVGESTRLNRYLARFRTAGKELADNGDISEDTLKRLSKAPFDNDTYRILLDRFWKIQEETTC